MRTIFLAFAALTLSASPVVADQSDPRLEPLFHKLSAVRTAPEAAAVEVQINGIWLKSGSDTVDVLMSRAQMAVEAQDLGAAKKLFDAIVEMKPDYAEVWYRRAELLLAMDSQQEAAADLRKVLALEPRHYKAFAVIGRLADLSGDKQAALAAYRKAVLINPMLEAIARRAAQITFELERKPPS